MSFEFPRSIIVMLAVFFHGFGPTLVKAQDTVHADSIHSEIRPWKDSGYFHKVWVYRGEPFTGVGLRPSMDPRYPPAIRIFTNGLAPGAWEGLWEVTEIDTTWWWYKNGRPGGWGVGKLVMDGDDEVAECRMEWHRNGQKHYEVLPGYGKSWLPDGRLQSEFCQWSRGRWFRVDYESDGTIDDFRAKGLLRTLSGRRALNSRRLKRWRRRMTAIRARYADLPTGEERRSQAER